MPLDYIRDPSPSVSPLIVRCQAPYNAETPLPLLIEDFVTPTQHHFVRSHGPIPDLDVDSHVIEVGGEVLQSLKLTVPEIRRRYEHVSVVVALQCAGNRRDQLNEVRPTKGVIWGSGAVGNASWTGVRLRDVLLEAGVPSDPQHPWVRNYHVSFESVELCEEAPCYGSSIPLEKAMDPVGDVLLAFEMNGAPLPRKHGFPIRVIVPGYIGARSVKFLSRITVQPTESSSYYQQHDYKILPPHIDEKNVDPTVWQTYPSLLEPNVQSVICDLTLKSLRPGPHTIRGYALSGGGRPIIRVDLSLDGGINWIQAKLKGPDPTMGTRPWGWFLWEATASVPERCGRLVCRAWDASGNTQPEKPVWNYRGVMNNAWFEVILPFWEPSKM